MNRKKAVTVAVAILALLIMVGVVLFLMGGNIPNTKKIAVSNVRIDLGVQSATVNYGVVPPSVNYTVENLNNIDITAVSVGIDGANYAQTSLLVPPGHSVSTSTFLSDAVLSGSTTYNIEFVFTFADGSSDTYSTSYATP
jgi:hypothetical protein